MKKNIKRYIVIALCAVIIACSVVSPMKVKASSVNASRIVDVALTKTGIVANQSILKAVEDKLVVVVRDTLKLYDAWLDENPDKEISADTFNEFVNSGGLSTFAYRAIEPYLNRKFIKTLMSEYREALDEAPVDIGEVLTGEKSLLGKIISIPSGLINFIRSLFDEYEEENADYFYMDTYSPEDVNVNWFADANGWNNFCYALKNYDGLLHFHGQSLNGSDYNIDSECPIYYWKVFLIPNDTYFVKASASQYENINLKPYDSNWINPISIKSQSGTSIDQATIGNITDLEASFITENTLNEIKDSFGIKQKNYAFAYCGIWTSDGRPIKVFKTASAMKNHSVGNQPYYVTNNALSYEKTDNSVDISGDFIESATYQYSHDIVQTEINNNETVDNSVVNNVVNNSSSTIINNYYASTENNGSSDDSDGGGGLLDGLGGLIGGVTDFLGFIFGMLGDAISLVTTLFNTIFEGIKALGSIFTGFTGLLGDLFGFIPSELINFLVLAVEAGVAVTLWKQFKK